MPNTHAAEESRLMFSDDFVTIHHGDARALAPTLSEQIFGMVTLAEEAAHPPRAGKPSAGATSSHNGQPIRYDEARGAWLPLHADGATRCPKCGCEPTPEGHDACLGTIPGAISACCGHGAGNPFVVYPDVETLKAGCCHVTVDENDHEQTERVRNHE